VTRERTRCASGRSPRAAGPLAGAIRIGAAVSIWAVLAVPAPMASAEAGTELRAAARWLPTFSVGFDVQNESLETQLDSSLGIPASDGKLVLSSVFRFDAALYSPVLASGFGSPRVVFQAGAQVPLSKSQSALRFDRQVPFNDAAVSTLCDQSVANVDSCDHSGAVELRNQLSWIAGLGVEFTLPFAQRQFKLRPSIDYFGRSLKLNGMVERMDLGDPGVVGPSGLLQTTSISASSSQLLHALGPRVSLDIEAARLARFSLNVYFEGQLYWIFSDRSFAFGGSNNGDTASFGVAFDPLVSQGGAGLRIVWTGD
jgi:hypothetical protein